MRTAWSKWRRRRQMIREWKRYYRSVNHEEFLQSNGLGHPEWVVKPPFPDPRDRLHDLR